ncbi:hypothetical protein ACQP60_18895 [Isoptericola variabilis]|uniref:phage terminase small subunit n=1 Tax=Isoptericola variabilis TaxID=139208 RepID=UPI003D211B9B
MAGMGPAPKPASTRARRNKTTTRATLKADASIIAPELPANPNGWHDMVLEWWRDLWASPMAPEYDDADRHGLFELAMLRNDFWNATSLFDRKMAATEIRLQDQRFGLSPIDRRRLQWEIERTDEAQDKGARRRNTKAADRGEAQGKPAGDPRVVLSAV